MEPNYLQGHVGIGLRHALAGCSLDVARVLPNLATWQCWQIFRAEEKNNGGTYITSVDREMSRIRNKLVDWIKKHYAHFISELHSRV